MSINSAVNTKPLFDGDFLRQLEKLAILSRQVVAGKMQGERRSPKRGQSVEFADFRPYSLGDDIRRIDWNAFARLERYFIKLFVEEEDIQIHLLIDSSASMNWGTPDKFQYAVKAAAALGYIGLVGLDKVSAIALSSQSNGHYFSPHRGKAQTHAFFSFLQSLAPQGKVNLKQQALAYSAAHKQPGPLLLFTDLMDESWKEGLRILAAQQYEITLLQILSPDEVNPEFSGDLKLLDSETNRDIEVTADFDLVQKYKQELKSWQDEVQIFCSKRSIQYISLETSLPLQELLFTWLRRQSVLR